MAGNEVVGRKVRIPFSFVGFRHFRCGMKDCLRSTVAESIPQGKTMINESRCLLLSSPTRPAWYAG